MHLLPTNLAPLADICEDSHRSRTGGVLLELKGGGRFRAASTDCKRLIVVDGAEPADPTDYPALPQLAAVPNGKASGVIPARAWKSAMSAAAKLTRRCYRSELRAVGAVIGETVATFAATDGTSTTADQPALADGRFPDLDGILPPETSATTYKVTFDPVRLAGLLTALAKLSHDPDEAAVEFRFRDADGRKLVEVALTSGAEVGQTVRGFIMPMTD